MSENFGNNGAGSLPAPFVLDDPSTSLYDAEGVDRSVIRECLSRTPAERLDLADSYAQEIETLRLHLHPVKRGA